MSDEKETYYHHTTKNGAMQILQSGYIKKSTDMVNDATYGPGAYLTKYGPEKSQSEIAENNYDGINNTFAKKMMDEGKTDAIIAVDLPSNQVHRATKTRDIYVSKGNVQLKGNNPKVYLRDANGKAVEYKQK
ncbi:uncharacterized protein LOC132553299 [Ylistrum balloti]|uniref:uncharacterized protein LOC132553299 n=1 Tax=Ylistrum balloti TaxID=509963 RepID=UPI002905CB2A|nr:uncharacterized protein LOC132553299 [Ylistrum balloti]